MKMIMTFTKGQNFVMDQAHIKSQLADLKTLIEFVDSNFSTYLQEKESSNMYFCFRWILILFKREFSFPDIMKLWEVCINLNSKSLTENNTY